MHIFEAFKLVIFNKDLYGEIKKHRFGKSYRESPGHVINVFVKNNFGTDKYELYDKIYENFDHDHKMLVFKKDNAAIYEKFKHNITVDCCFAVTHKSVNIIESIIAKNDIAPLKINNGPLIVYLVDGLLENIYYHTIDIIPHEISILVRKLLLIMEENMIPIYIRYRRDGVIYHIKNNKAIRTKVPMNMNMTISINMHARDFIKQFL